MAAIVPGRMIIVTVLTATAFGAGWFKGAAHATRQADQLEAAVRATGQAAQARAVRIAQRQTTLNQETDHAHRAGLAALSDHFRLRLPGLNAGGGAVPSLSAPAFGPGARPADPGPAAAGTAPGLAQACAETTLMFLDLRRAWREQAELGIPMSEAP
jgi:hypothetical protein